MHVGSRTLNPVQFRVRSTSICFYNLRTGILLAAKLALAKDLVHRSHKGVAAPRVWLC